MDKIKPYLFWIICGVLLIAELVVALTLEPVNSNNKTAVQATKALNSEVSSLSGGYGVKADNDPVDPFKIDDWELFQKMQEDYLLTSKWKPALDGVKKELETHKANVESNLQKRSKVLHDPVKRNASRADWYFTYEALTAKYLKELYEAQPTLLGLDSDPFSNAQDNADKEDIYKADKRLRETVGFYTKGQDFPNINEQPIIALRLRISEAIISAVKDAEGSLLVNALVNHGAEEFILSPEDVVKAQLKKIYLILLRMSCGSLFLNSC
ncbi:MAG: hypothetical protein HRU15_15330 [Planctomycetes bacterium]|nr:hypothetical protein [Planctomycetota bacterium]